MSDEEIRIAVAEVAGWSDVKERPHPLDPNVMVLSGYFEVSKYPAFIPDYPNDLNAAHEVEGAIGDDWHKYSEVLNEMVNPEVRMSREREYWCLIRATARQRCEALLRTFGKWRDQ